MQAKSIKNFDIISNVMKFIVKFYNKITTLSWFCDVLFVVVAEIVVVLLVEFVVRKAEATIWKKALNNGIKLLAGLSEEIADWLAIFIPSVSISIGDFDDVRVLWGSCLSISWFRFTSSVYRIYIDMNFNNIIIS